MTAIHHATKARAEKNGIVLEVVQNDDIRALHMASGRYVVAAEPKTALAGALLAARLVTEYPRIMIGVNGDQITALVLVPGGDEPESQTIWEQDEEEKYDEDAAFVAILEAYDELELPEDEESDDDEPSGSVVPEKYRVMYAERGNPAHCGDFLASLLDGAFVSGERDTFDPAAFELFLRANGVPIEGKWSTLPQSGQSGWQGRYRMNGRQLLEKYVARAGFVVLGAEQIAIPKADLAELRTKHTKWIAKQEKAEAKAAEADTTEGEGEAA